MARRGKRETGGPPTDKASGTQNPASHHPHASDEQTDEEDDGAGGSSERAGARKRYGNEASRQTVAMPAAANQIDARTSHALGAGDYLRPASRGEPARGGRAKKKKEPLTEANRN